MIGRSNEARIRTRNLQIQIWGFNGGENAKPSYSELLRRVVLW